MTYKEIYNADTEYQDIIKEFGKAVTELQSRANQGVFKADALIEDAQAIHNNLSDAIREHYVERVAETNEAIQELDNSVKKVGIADRESDTKEFEMRYKLASNRDLEIIVQDLNTDDLLEVNLLRLELKSRGLDELDTKVKHYVIKHRIDGLSDSEQAEYDELQNKMTVYRTVGTNYFVAQDELKPLSQINKELWSIATSKTA